jgi:hypothetical protein
MLAGQSGLPNLSDEVSDNLVRNAIVEAFAESNPANGSKSKTGYPLGQLAEDLVIHFTG